MTRTKKLTEIAIAVAMAAICSFIKVWEMPMGGSISLTMVPILLISFRQGWKTGMIAGAVYGVVSIVSAGVIYHPMSILLDYVLAFGLLGLSGAFSKSTKGIIFGSFFGVGGRFLSSLVSGAVLFAEYAPEGQNPWIYSFVYQATYLIPELVISVVILIFLFKKVKQIF